MFLTDSMQMLQTCFEERMLDEFKYSYHKFKRDW